MNRLEIAAVVAVIVTSIIFMQGARDAADAYLMIRPISGVKQMQAVLGWLVATFGPIAVAVLLWRRAKRLHAPWPLHLLFLPCAAALHLLGEGLMLDAIGELDFDGTLGGPVLQAYSLFVASAALYFSAALWRSFGRWKDR